MITTKRVIVSLACSCCLLSSPLGCDERGIETVGKRTEAQTLSWRVPSINVDLEGTGVAVSPANPPLQLTDTGNLPRSWGSVSLRLLLEGSALGPLYAANKPYVSGSMHCAWGSIVTRRVSSISGFTVSSTTSASRRRSSRPTQRQPCRGRARYARCGASDAYAEYALNIEEDGDRGLVIRVRS